MPRPSVADAARGCRAAPHRQGTKPERGKALAPLRRLAAFAGVVLAESPLSQRATEEALPLRDAFAVLFFVSVGMLFDPGVLVRSPWAVLATVAVVVAGKPLAALLIVRGIFGRPFPEALAIAASLAQVGEFSFILAGLGASLGLLP